ncbi:MAG: Unknown protein [uncultured Sulfurovum sp.]|uniref:Uncharacterized protein n=1 Tax=uncultured Sulfurovum sp. TaxID=269237 RepID=A0A6S6TMK5_9BACT|nr:MAG: Unknown protein [uncultured Sulfurovum sp.]
MLPFEYTLEVKKDEIEFVYEYGLKLYFEPIKVGDESILTKKGFRLLHPDEQSYVVVLEDGKILQFKAYSEDKYKITAIADKNGNRLNFMFDDRRNISYITTQDNRLFELEYKDVIQDTSTTLSAGKRKKQIIQKQTILKKVRRIKSVTEHIFKKTILSITDKAQGKKEEELLLTENGKLLYLQFHNKQLQAIASYPKAAQAEIEEKSKLKTQESEIQTLVSYNYSKEADLIEVKDRRDKKSF